MIARDIGVATLYTALLFVLVLTITTLCGCNATMSTFYKSVSTASTLVATGYRMLDQADAQEQTVIVAQAKTDANAAANALAVYLKKYDAARMALTAASVVVQDANSAAPALELLTSGQSAGITTWLVKLATLAADVIASLQPLGVNITVDGFNVTSALAAVTQ